MIPNRLLDKSGTVASEQLWHRRTSGQIGSSSNRPIVPDGHYGSPHPAFHCTSSLLRNCSHSSNRVEFTNGTVFNSLDRMELGGTDRLLPQSINRHDSSPEPTYICNHLIDIMSPIFRTLKLFGFYVPSFGREFASATASPHRLSSVGLRSRNKITILCFILATYAVVGSVFNLGLFGLNTMAIEDMRQESGLLNVQTMTNIISGMKPLHNALNLFFFFWGAKYHAILWRQLADIDGTFRRHLSIKLDVRKAKFIFLMATCVCFLLPFFLRASEYFLLETVGEDHISDFSLLFVPLLSVWQLMPLYYYLLITTFIQWWLRKLRGKIQNDSDLTERPLEFYYGLYLRLTKSIATLGAFFNPVAFFSLSISVVVLCLTIYFLTNAKEIVNDSAFNTEERIEAYFYLSWSCAHILVAIGYVLALCVAGWRTNEQARAIMAAVLSSKPNDEQSRFRVVCFLHRNQTQWHWGVTVWRAFPVERSFLFTLVSAISTYAVLLLKLQQKPCICTYSAGPNLTMGIE